MKALKMIGVILLIVIVLLLVIAIFLPSEMKVEQSMTMKAPAEIPFEQVNTMENWAIWSPFEDTGMVTTYKGIGVGATQTWEMDGESGKLSIIGSNPYENIKTEIDLGQDEAKVKGHWTFDQSGDSTRVSWGIIFTELAYPLGRYMGLIQKGMMKDYLKNGLKNIKEISEKLAKIPQDVEITTVTVEKQYALAIKDTVKMQEMAVKMEDFFTKLANYFAQNDIQMAAPPFTIYYTWDGQQSYLAAGIPTMEPLEGEGEIVPITIEPGEALMAIHEGPYETMAKTYNALEQYAEIQGLELMDMAWEVYITDPQQEPNPEQWVTNVYFPLK